MTPTEIHVVAAALVDEAGRVLVNRRPEGKPMAGRWEFPGGKLDPDEAREAGLRRELAEELGIELGPARPLIRLRHDYPEHSVLLDVWLSGSWTGTPSGLDGQELRWIRPEELGSLDLLPADGPIIKALSIPDSYVITPRDADRGTVLDGLEAAVADGYRLFQFRRDALDEELLDTALECVHRAGARLLLNGAPADAGRSGADGVHLAARCAAAFTARPLSPEHLVGVSCHDPGELEHAERIGADFAVLGPVLATTSHPDATPMGWGRFAELVDRVKLPVYALGGVGPRDLETAWEHGAQGVAGISAFWD